MNSKPNGILSKLQTFLAHDLWNLEPAALSKTRAAGLKVLRVCMLVAKGFKEDQCPLHASALTFITVMALVPFLAILFAIGKAIGLDRGSEMLLEKTAEMTPQIQEAATTIIRTVESASAGAMAGIGGVLFLWIAIKMLSNIEETFNTLWGVKDSRSFIDKIRNYIAIIVITPILLIVATTAQPIFIGFASQLEWMGSVLTLGLRVVPVLTMAIAFSIVYVFLPNTQVKFGSAFTGALVAALLSVAFQFLMIYASVGIGRNSAVYGTLAAIPIFLFWVQTSWMILLMGAEVAFSIQNAGTYARERLAVTPSTRAQLCLAIVLMKKIMDRFESPEPPFDTIAYGIENHVPVRLISDVIHTLAQAGLVAESAEHPGCYTLLRDPLTISARDITDAILDNGTAPAALGLAEDLPTFGNITDESFHCLEKQILKTF